MTKLEAELRDVIATLRDGLLATRALTEHVEQAQRSPCLPCEDYVRGLRSGASRDRALLMACYPVQRWTAQAAAAMEIVDNEQLGGRRHGN